MKIQNSFGNRYASPHMTFRKALAIAFSCFFVLLGGAFWGGSDFVYDRVVHPLLFSARNKLDRFNPLDSHIKMYAVDHQTLTDIQLESVPIEDWISLFRSLAKAEPRAVFIDKTFPLPLSKNDSDIQRLGREIQNAAPVTAGAFFVPSLITGFSEISASDLKGKFEDLEGVPSHSGHFYGPDKGLLPYFSNIGHTNYEDNGYILPVIRVGSQQAMPFWGLALDSGLKSQAGTLTFNSHVIPTDSKGRVLVNLAPADQYWKKTYSVVNLLRKSRAGQELTEIQKGDIVLIFADMVQGATGFKNTPAGTMPGAFIMAEVLNSGLSGVWLKSYQQWEPWALFVACLIGILLAVYLGGFAFGCALFTLEVVLIGMGVLIFCYQGVLLPWFFPALGLLCSSILIFFEKARVSDLKSRDLHLSLEDMIGPQKLKKLMKSNLASWLEPKSKVLTVMFIDIVGFSSTAEEYSPSVIFPKLREVLGSISDIVHGYGGIVDKSMGDGLLCFFGYELAEQEVAHAAQQALYCAVEIQKDAVQRNLDSVGRDPFFPLRIGINTGEVYIGDLGGKRKVDFTLVGRCVNYAQRLESACEVYRILCGISTGTLLMKKGMPANRFAFKKIPVKKQIHLGEAYEYDPLFDSPDKLSNALARQREAIGLTRSDERFPIMRSQACRIQTGGGEGFLLDYSKSGISVEMASYFSAGTIFNMNFKSDDGELQKACHAAGIGSVTGIVRWGYPGDNGYRHGILFTDLTPEQKEKLFSYLRIY